MDTRPQNYAKMALLKFVPKKNGNKNGTVPKLVKIIKDYKKLSKVRLSY